MRAAIVTLNAGSSSVKAALYALPPSDESAAPSLLSRIQVADIGGPDMSLQVTTPGRLAKASPMSASSGSTSAAMDAAWSAAFEALSAGLADAGVRDSSVVGVGHRIVHGGLDFSAPARLSPDVRRKLEALASFAPAHQPFNLEGAERAARCWPGAVQIGCFDTSFHRTQTKTVDRFALPRRYADAGILRYGFHGLSYEFIANAAPDLIGSAAKGRCIVAHLGAGASMCAMENGRSVATTMGLTALDGLPMATRCGAIDPGAVLHLMSSEDLSPDEMAEILHRRSGLLGLSGISGDMRVLLASEAIEAAEAVEHFVHRCVREIGALAATLGGLDALVFTAGVGENAAPVRERIVSSLAWLGFDLDRDANSAGGPRLTASGSKLSAWVIPTDEELVIARSVARMLA